MTYGDGSPRTGLMRWARRLAWERRKIMRKVLDGSLIPAALLLS